MLIDIQTFNARFLCQSYRKNVSADYPIRYSLAFIAEQKFVITNISVFMAIVNSCGYEFKKLQSAIKILNFN
jgi:hypothetical protein